MMFQTWTAFGIMFGYVMNFAFRNVRDPPGIRGLNWRLMLGSVSIRFPSELAPLKFWHFMSAGWGPCAHSDSSSVLLSGVAPVVHDEGPLP